MSLLLSKTFPFLECSCKWGNYYVFSNLIVEYYPYSKTNWINVAWNKSTKNLQQSFDLLNDLYNVFITNL